MKKLLKITTLSLLVTIAQVDVANAAGKSGYGHIPVDTGLAIGSLKVEYLLVALFVYAAGAFIIVSSKYLKSKI